MRLTQGRKNAAMPSHPKSSNALTFFCILYFMLHGNAYVCTTKFFCTLLTFTENFAPFVLLEYVITRQISASLPPKSTFVHTLATFFVI